MRREVVKWKTFRNLFVLWVAGLLFTLLNVEGEELVIGTTGAFLVALIPILAMAHFFGKRSPSSSLRVVD